MKDPRRQPYIEFKHPDNLSDYIKLIKPIINNNGFDEVTWTVLFNFHNQFVLPEAPEWSKSCSSCRKRVKNRVTEWIINNT